MKQYSNYEFKEEIFLFTQNNIGKHYDLAILIKINNEYYLHLFQVTMNKPKNKIEKIKKFVFVDINFIQ